MLRERAAGFERYLRRLQDDRAWGGNWVPRSNGRASYRAIGADPGRPSQPMAHSEPESTIYLNSERVPEYEKSGIVIDLRHRIKGNVEHILPRD